MDYKQISRFINHRQSKEDLVPGNESVLALQHTTNTDKQAYILDEVRAPQIGKLTIKQWRVFSHDRERVSMFQTKKDNSNLRGD